MALQPIADRRPLLWLERSPCCCVGVDVLPFRDTQKVGEHRRFLVQEICCSRMFGNRLTTIEPIKEAVATYTQRAAEKLRAQNS